MKIVTFVGYSGSGKTSAIECVARTLTSRGKRVGVLKHLHAERLSAVSTKDTDRFLNSGASAVCAVTRDGVFLHLKDADVTVGLRLLEGASLDFLLVEGFSTHPFFSRKDLPCVVCAKSADEAETLLQVHHARKVVCITGVIALNSDIKALHGLPVFKLPDETDSLITLFAS